MKKQLFLAGVGLIFVLLLFFLGKTISEKKSEPIATDKKVQAFDIQSFIQNQKLLLTPTQANFFTQIENKFNQGDNKLKTEAYMQAANFWNDSISSPEIYAYFISESSKLDNSEKNLTFAAQLFLNSLRGEQNLAKLEWESAEAISLFEKAIAINPENEDLKIGLASCYVYGKGRNGNPQETMKGIQELLGVVRRDSTNMKAQLVLGVGGYVSGQFDKAVARLTKVVAQEPNNLEAIAFLADTYAALGNMDAAVKWYNISKRLANDASYSKEIDERLKTLFLENKKN